MRGSPRRETTLLAHDEQVPSGRTCFPGRVVADVICIDRYSSVQRAVELYDVWPAPSLSRRLRSRRGAFCAVALPLAVSLLLPRHSSTDRPAAERGAPDRRAHPIAQLSFACRRHPSRSDCSSRRPQADAWPPLFLLSCCSGCCAAAAIHIATAAAARRRPSLSSPVLASHPPASPSTRLAAFVSSRPHRRGLRNLTSTAVACKTPPQRSLPPPSRGRRSTPSVLLGCPSATSPAAPRRSVSSTNASSLIRLWEPPPLLWVTRRRFGKSPRRSN
ncbi:hypothetical protein P154DRAFT_332248 [Amniculicola lignicola CBS 123094]|uniref:Uncharacterized protein n=1 Tax=Amniculicola lignicola CBS 123094 TaxID=1392246 RepID=A0A6A5W1W4_9PLEO|nr:hypothetical protein P154DRAFT_332248 [Amniculicola lignicola CBS 123094]